MARVRAARPEADRHALHLAALGTDKSSREFSNEDFDRVLAAFRALSDSTNLDAQLRQIAQPRARLLWSLEHIVRPCLTLYVEQPDAYIRAVCQARFAAADYHDLGDPQLHQLRITLWARLHSADGLRSQAGHSLHDMYLLAGLQCDCAACVRARTRKPKPRPVPEYDLANAPF